MGQQQLLLIVVALLVISIAIFVGFQIFDETHRESAIDFMTQDLANLAGVALNYYRKPVDLGGGGNSFNGGNTPWEVPSQLATMNDRTYEVSSISPNTLELKGTSNDLRTGNDGSTGVLVYVEIDPYGITQYRIEN